MTGAGRAFCAGADMGALSSIAGGGPGAGLTNDADAPWRADDGDFAGRFAYMMKIGKPIIAAVNGAVAGMAYPFALCCDVRVVTPDALFVTAFAQRGLIAEWGLSWLLPRLVGPSVALDLLFTSRRVKEKRRWPSVWRTTSCLPDELLTFCRDYIEKLAQSSSPTSMAIMKRQVYEHFHQGLGAAEQHAYQLMVDSLYQSDFKEGVQSFVDKRPPKLPAHRCADRGVRRRHRQPHP